VAATRKPFLQTIQDLSVRRMAVGRIALVGDAAFIPRPHTAASTSCDKWMTDYRIEGIDGLQLTLPDE
jgi:hypothetical protein